MHNRFFVEVIRKELNAAETVKCLELIKILQKKTNLINVSNHVFTCNLNDNLAVLFTVHFANQLTNYPQYFSSIRCFDRVSGSEKYFIKETKE